MLEPKSFRERWQSSDRQTVFIDYVPAMFETINLPAESIAFLLEAGLPESAAPFLDMCQPSMRPLSSVAENWNLSAAFVRYREIGTDGAGNPFCIEEGSGNVLLLDHNNRFAAVFVNTTVQAFAAFLLAYQEFVRQVIAANGKDAFLDNIIPDELRRKLAAELQDIDIAAVQPETFWLQELTQL